MIYTKNRYPDAMKDLPEEVRNKAIQIANSIIHDGDTRLHEDIIITGAIREAKKWARENNPDHDK
jgi:uncharacterized protein YdaT